MFSVVCTPIKVVTRSYGKHNSWTFGDCRSSQVYESNLFYTEKCCQKPGSYPISCKDSAKDGWHGGYLEIEGTKYCTDFMDGLVKTEEATMGKNKNLL